MASKVQVTVVVNGQPAQVEAEPRASAQSLVGPALRLTGNIGQPEDSWELRDAAGQLVAAQRKVEEFVGQTLFLNLKAGIGGSV